MTTTLSSPKWPSLSLDLTGPKSPDRCQHCSVGPPLEVWREHNDFDGPTNVVVVLCPACAARLIEPHPRLYSQLERHEPFPGAMPICVDCKHREGVRCPKAKFNGGPGILLSLPQPSQVHVCRRGKGQRSGWLTIYRGPVTACDGKEVSDGP